MVLRFHNVAVDAMACPLAFKMLLWLQWRGASISTWCCGCSGVVLVLGLQYRAPSLSKYCCDCNGVVFCFHNVAVAVITSPLAFDMVLWLQWRGPSLAKCCCGAVACPLAFKMLLWRNGVVLRLQNVAVAEVLWSLPTPPSLATSTAKTHSPSPFVPSCAQPLAFPYPSPPPSPHS